VAVTGAAIAAKAGGGPAVKRVGAYVKAHWKELLALTFAAIPAIFILLHTGARKAVQQTLTLPPLGTGAPSSDSTTSGATTPPFPPAPGDTHNCPPGQHWQPSIFPPPGAMWPVQAPGCVPDVAPASIPNPKVKEITADLSSGWSVNGSNTRVVPPPLKDVPPPPVKNVPPPPPPPPPALKARPITIVPDLTQRAKRGGPVG